MATTLPVPQGQAEQQMAACLATEFRRWLSDSRAFFLGPLDCSRAMTANKHHLQAMGFPGQGQAPRPRWGLSSAGCLSLVRRLQGPSSGPLLRRRRARGAGLRTGFS